MSTIEADIEAMREAVGASSDAHLAEILGYTRAAIAHWKRRGSIPRKAISRAAVLTKRKGRSRALQNRRQELGNQVLYEGRCLALFLAPSRHAFGVSYGPSTYSHVLRNYASYFDEIETVCAEEVADRLTQIEGNASDAFESLALEKDKDALLERILDRAMQWRDGDPNN